MAPVQRHEPTRCALCGQTEGHSPRCSVTRHGVDASRFTIRSRPGSGGYSVSIAELDMDGHGVDVVRVATGEARAELIERCTQAYANAFSVTHRGRVEAALIEAGLIDREETQTDG